ncbi:MAG: PDZ domain-containing protein [Candidatus Rokubacteria bacterium]|nr:PDZ domain-containing protein [Candidatus Rokubacteria bacterium]
MVRVGTLALVVITFMTLLPPFVGIDDVLGAKQWAWLGVRIRDLSEQEAEDLAAKHGIREGFGAMIVEVIEGTPAQKSGLKAGDVVVAIDDRPVVETRALQRLIAAAEVDRETRLTVLRPEGRRALRVRLAAMPPEVAGERVAAEFGFVLRDLEAGDGARLPRPVGTSPTVGVVIRGGAAERAGLEVGDVVLQVGDRPVVSRDAAREALAEAGLDQPLRLTVRRGDARVALTISPVENRLPWWGPTELESPAV